MSAAEHTEMMPICREKFENIDNRLTGLHDRHKERIDEAFKAVEETEKSLQTQFEAFRKEVKDELKTISDRMIAVFVIVLGQALGMIIYFLMRR